MGTRNFSEASFRLLYSYIEEKVVIKHGLAKLDVYDGKESVEETIRKFHSADVVLLYHGAAAANMVFAKRGAHIIEITTFAKSDDSIGWRANVQYLFTHRPDIKTLVYFIPLSHGWPGLNLTSVDELGNKADHYVKALSNITLRRSDVLNLGNIVKGALEKKT